MKIINLLSVMLLSWIFAKGQTQVLKPCLDTSSFDRWPRIIYQSTVVSRNGKYVLYPLVNGYNNNNIIIQSFNGWSMRIAGVRNATFTSDSRRVIFKKGHDSLCIQDLGSKKAQYILGVTSFKIFKQDTDEWLIYQVSTINNELVLINLSNGIIKHFYGVSSYVLTKYGKNVLITRKTMDVDIPRTNVSLISIPSGNELFIWEGYNPTGFTFDDSGSKVAFISDNLQKDVSGIGKLLWFYQHGSNKATLILNDEMSRLDSGLTFHSIDRFSADGKRLFFRAQEFPLPIVSSAATKVDIWSYLDAKLQSQQLADLKENILEKNYLHVLSIHDRKIVRLQKEDEEVIILKGDKEEIVFIKSFQVDADPLEPWNRFAHSSNYLFFPKSERKVNIEFKLANSNPPIISPDGNYLLLMDEKDKDVYSYELNTGLINNLTKGLPIPLGYDKGNRNDDYHEYRLLKVAAWTKNGNILLYDEYDIWQLDPSGKKNAVCVTNGYGRRNKIDFKLVDKQNSYDDDVKVINPAASILLSAFDRVKKYNGFYNVKMDNKKKLVELSMFPDIFFVSTTDLSRGLRPIKIAGTNKWIVTRENATSSPNLFYTNDFKSFSPISNMHPEKDYNWLTSTVVNFKTLSGDIEQGVLYKPENFDSTKHYPVIIHYYEQLSDYANLFKHPFPISHGIDIPWFVSNGYLVFTPDIRYTIGHIGESALNSVEGAAIYLKKIAWIDSTKIGLQGHSLGGYETNYIVTHSHTFAAAMSSAGESDFISAYNSLFGGIVNGTSSFQTFHDLGVYRLGVNLWENPSVYINNSPIFQAAHVTTPLLMMNNKMDGIVDFSQGVEFFTALRRLGKRVWMLQYDNGSHTVDEKDALQHTVRITQFFDHYLKGTAAGEWMIKGVPAKQKGINDGLKLSIEVNSEGKPITPGAGLLTSEEQKKINELQNRPPVSVTIK